MEKGKTGYPSIDKPWLKYYSFESLNRELPKGSLYEYLWECNKDRLDNYAINYFGNKITYRKLFELIDEAAKAFIAIGVNEGEIVPVVTLSSVTSVVCFYALNKIGAISDYINVLSEEKDYQGFFNEANAKVVVTLDLFAEKVINAAKKTGVDTVIIVGINIGMPAFVNIGYKLKSKGKIPKIPDFDNLLTWETFINSGKKTAEINRSKNPNEMCFLAHTGGTTGESKAVMLNDKAMNTVASQQYSIYCQCPEWSENSVFLQVMIPFVVYGILTCTHLPLCMGWCLAIIPKFEGKDWKKYISKYKFEHTIAVPAYVSCLLEDESLKKANMTHIKTISVGGDGITDSLENNMNQFLAEHGSGAELYKGYGMTEICAAGVICFPGCNRIGSVGIPLPLNNLMIYDNENNSELKYKEVGEVCIHAPSRMAGYLNNEKATKELFKIHSDGSEWLHTGDLGYIDEDGFLFLVGRMKRIILTTKDGIAYKVFPSVPEKILESHSAVIQNCIVGAKKGNDEVLRAYVVLSEDNLGNAEKIEEELRELCIEKLPTHERPTYYEFRDKLPLTAAGKVDYRALEV